MSAEPADQAPALLLQFKKALSATPEHQVLKFNGLLLPCSGTSDPYESIMRSMAYRLSIVSWNVPPREVGTSILAKCKLIGAQLEQSLRELFDGGFLERLKMNELTILLDSSESSKENALENTLENQVLRFSNMFTKTKRKYQKKNQTVNQKAKVVKKVDQVSNIEEGCCSCGCLLLPLEPNAFLCAHCNSSVHLKCARKNIKSPTNQCLPCHLKLMILNKPCVKQLFLGVLRKESKIHEFSFEIKEEDLKAGRKMQIRCFRLKESPSPLIQFPDLAAIEINGNVVKQFQPLMRHSSLKCRRDEPVTFPYSELTAEKLTVIINEQPQGMSTNNGDRIEPEDHLIGFYLVEELSCSQLCRSIEETNLTSFQESLKLLRALWRVESNIQEVWLEKVKVLLECPISAKRITLPARGAFCRHFQCFDLLSYVSITAQAVSPRWLCPVCRLPAYDLRVDIILLTILTMHPEALTEVFFFSTDQYSLACEKQMSEDSKRSLHSLDIREMRKRRREVEQGESGMAGRRREEAAIGLME